MPQINLFHGEITARSAKELREAISIIGTPLTCWENFAHGPLKPIHALDELAAVRTAFWADHGQKIKPTAFLADFRSFMSELLKADQIRIWANTSVQEQIHLIAMLAAIRDLGIPSQNVQVIEFPQYNILTGFVSSDTIANQPAPVPLTNLNELDYVEAWDALIDAEPERLSNFVIRSKQSLPIVRALREYIKRFPDIRSGLGSIERSLLTQLSDEWLGAPYPIANLIAAYSRDRVGDLILFKKLVALSDCSQNWPPVELRGDTKAMRYCEARITEFGKACLRGEANHVRTNGIDDWIGGVHLSSDENRIWFYDGGQVIRG